ncbi:hypothetical protein ZWY2020_034174 [Hordeum vulgare]|nr:hypothetical protein ZWY2020_034174 [Hordeum vulgare]
MERRHGGRWDHQHQQDDDGAGGGCSLFAPGPYGQFGTDQSFAFAGQHGGVSLTLSLPTVPAIRRRSNGRQQQQAPTARQQRRRYDMNMQTTKSFAAHLMRYFVA